VRVLVTGSKGQLGSDIRDESAFYPEIDFDFTDIEELDLTNAHAVDQYFSLNNPDYCLNCAAYTAVDKAEDEPDLALLINEGTVKTLAQTCKKYKTKLIHVSTDYIFDGTNHRPYSEDDQATPDSAYGLSKLKGEQAIEQLNPDSMIIRTSWLYSSYGHNFVKTMIHLSQERDEIKVVADQVGTPTYSGDLAKAILMIITNFDKKQLKGIYHYSNEGVISWFDFAKAIMEITHASCKVLPIESKDFPAKANRPFYSVLNKSKIKSDFNLEIPYWKDSLEIAIQKIKNNKSHE
jgi:dTDP-4-dehydrorhamnose reductase